LLQNDVSVSVGSQSDNGKEFHSFLAQAAKLRGPKVELQQASTCKLPRAAECKWRRLVLPAVTRNTQLLEVLRCGLMATLEGDRAELENYPLWNYLLLAMRISNKIPHISDLYRNDHSAV